ncbi:hypothetical protein KAH94_00920, partial [bacterium]|nr:hypothetical protein [bacterium]
RRENFNSNHFQNNTNSDNEASDSSSEQDDEKARLKAEEDLEEKENESVIENVQRRLSGKNGYKWPFLRKIPNKIEDLFFTAKRKIKYTLKSLCCDCFSNHNDDY